jgi:hypothetical protein
LSHAPALRLVENCGKLACGVTDAAVFSRKVVPRNIARQVQRLLSYHKFMRMPSTNSLMAHQLQQERSVRVLFCGDTAHVQMMLVYVTSHSNIPSRVQLLACIVCGAKGGNCLCIVCGAIGGNSLQTACMMVCPLACGRCCTSPPACCGGPCQALLDPLC